MEINGVKICKNCGKSAEQVNFTEHKAVCNQCRAIANREGGYSVEAIISTWKTRNTDKTKIILRGTDPCIKCSYHEVSCQFCVVFHMKQRYLMPDTEEGKSFVRSFNKNLKENIKEILKSA